MYDHDIVYGSSIQDQPLSELDNLEKWGGQDESGPEINKMNAEMSGIDDMDEQGSKDEPSLEINQMDLKVGEIDSMEERGSKDEPRPEINQMDAEMSGINNVDEQGSKDEPGPEINQMDPEVGEIDNMDERGSIDDLGPEINQMDPEASGVDNIQDENGNPKLKGREAYILQRLPITYTLLLSVLTSVSKHQSIFFLPLPSGSIKYYKEGVSTVTKQISKFSPQSLSTRLL